VCRTWIGCRFSIGITFKVQVLYLSVLFLVGHAAFICTGIVREPVVRCLICRCAENVIGLNDFVCVVSR
jgi:hypothetical protein